MKTIFQLTIVSIVLSYIIPLLDSSYSQETSFFFSFGVFTVLYFFISSDKKEVTTTRIENDSSVDYGDGNFINHGTVNIYMSDKKCKRQLVNTGQRELIDMLEGKNVIEYMEESKRHNHDLAYSIHLLTENGDISKDEARQLEAHYLEAKPSKFRSTTSPLLEKYEEVAVKLSDKLSEKEIEINKLKESKEKLDLIEKAWLLKQNKNSNVTDTAIIPRQAIPR